LTKPKKHHFIPKSYLSGFTTLTDKKKEELWVIDQNSATLRPSTPKNEAHKRYLYRVDVHPGGDEFGIEKAFSEFETLSIPILKEMGETRCIPSGEKYSILINYITLQIIRTPKFRTDYHKMLSSIGDQMHKITLQIITQSKAYFEKYIEDMLARKPHLKKEDFEYEKIKNSIDNVTIEADIDQNYYVEQSIKLTDKLLPLLGNRIWRTFVPKNGNSHFITSDNPVALIWSDQKNYGRPIGYGLEGTDVIFPINKSMVIIGRFNSKRDNFQISDKKLAFINNCIAGVSDRFIYSCKKDILWLQINGKTGGTKEILDYIQHRVSK
jgi:hypothetical protein